MNLFCQRDRTDLDICHNPYHPCHLVDGIIINEIEQTLNRCFNPYHLCLRVDEEQISEIGQALDGRRIHACVVCVEEITLRILLDD